MIVHDVEQRSPEWYALRAGMPTASEFSKIVTSKGEASKSISGYAYTLAVEKYAGRPVDAWEGNYHTDRGRELEEHALNLYALMHDTEVHRVGFVTDADATMGCSPDGLVGDDGVVEVKCLKAENHAKAIVYYRKNGKSPPDYVQQTQGQMMICGRKWCDLIFHHPELPPLVIRVTPDADVTRGLTAHIPALLTERDNILTELHAMEV